MPKKIYIVIIERKLAHHEYSRDQVPFDDALSAQGFYDKIDHALQNEKKFVEVSVNKTTLLLRVDEITMIGFKEQEVPTEEELAEQREKYSKIGYPEQGIACLPYSNLFR